MVRVTVKKKRRSRSAGQTVGGQSRVTGPVLVTPSGEAVGTAVPTRSGIPRGVGSGGSGEGAAPTITPTKPEPIGEVSKTKQREAQQKRLDAEAFASEKRLQARRVARDIALRDRLEGLSSRERTNFFIRERAEFEKSQQERRRQRKQLSVKEVKEIPQLKKTRPKKKEEVSLIKKEVKELKGLLVSDIFERSAKQEEQKIQTNLESFSQVRLNFFQGKLNKGELSERQANRLLQQDIDKQTNKLLQKSDFFKEKGGRRSTTNDFSFALETQRLAALKKGEKDSAGGFRFASNIAEVPSSLISLSKETSKIIRGGDPKNFVPIATALTASLKKSLKKDNLKIKGKEFKNFAFTRPGEFIAEIAAGFVIVGAVSKGTKVGLKILRVMSKPASKKILKSIKFDPLVKKALNRSGKINLKIPSFIKRTGIPTKLKAGLVIPKVSKAAVKAFKKTLKKAKVSIKKTKAFEKAKKLKRKLSIRELKKRLGSKKFVVEARKELKSGRRFLQKEKAEKITLKRILKRRKLKEKRRRRLLKQQKKLLKEQEKKRRKKEIVEKLKKTKIGKKFEKIKKALRKPTIKIKRKSILGRLIAKKRSLESKIKKSIQDRKIIKGLKKAIKQEEKRRTKILVKKKRFQKPLIKRAASELRRKLKILNKKVKQLENNPELPKNFFKTLKKSLTRTVKVKDPKKLTSIQRATLKRFKGKLKSAESILEKKKLQKQISQDRLKPKRIIKQARRAIAGRPKKVRRVRLTGIQKASLGRLKGKLKRSQKKILIKKIQSKRLRPDQIIRQAKKTITLQKKKRKILQKRKALPIRKIALERSKRVQRLRKIQRPVRTFKPSTKLVLIQRPEQKFRRILKNIGPQKRKEFNQLLIRAKKLIEENKFNTNNQLIKNAKLNKIQKRSLQNFQKKTRVLTIQKNKLQSKRKRLIIREKQLFKGKQSKARQQQILQVRQKQKGLAQQTTTVNRQLSSIASRSFNVLSGALVSGQGLRLKQKQFVSQAQSARARAASKQRLSPKQTVAVKLRLAPKQRVAVKLKARAGALKLKKKGVTKKIIAFSRRKLKRTKRFKPKKKGFNVFAKPVKGKKLVKVNKVPLIKQRARDLRNFVLDTSLSRTGKIKPSKRKAQKPKLRSPVGFASRTRKKFRKFRQVKGKRKPLSRGKVIERSKRLLDTKQEIQGITLRRRIAQLQKPKKRTFTPKQRKVMLNNLEKARKAKRAKR